MGVAAAPAVVYGATIASTAIAAYSVYQSGQAAKEQAQYQRAVARNNEIIAERMAEDARVRGEEEARKTRLRSQQLASRQRVVLAQQGVAVDEGSALDLIGDTIALGEAEALTVRSNAEREALGFITQAQGFKSEAGLYGLQAGQASSAAGLGVASSIATGAGSVASKWYDMNKPKG